METICLNDWILKASLFKRVQGRALAFYREWPDLETMLEAVDDGAAARRTSLHGSCAARGGIGVLLLGGPGAGKSDLLLRLIDRGFDLVADDRVVIEDGHAWPPAALAGLIEIRGLGLLRMAHVAPVRLGLAILLEAPSVRLPQPERHPLGIPLLRMAPFAASAACRIEITLDCLAGRRSLSAGAL